MLRLTLTAAALVAVALPVDAAPNPVADWRTDPGLKHVPTDAFLFATVKVSKLWDSPAAKPLRDWAAAQSEEALAALVGVPPADVDRLTLFMPSAGDEALLVLVTTRKPFESARVLRNLGSGPGDRRPGRGSSRVAEIDGPFRYVALVGEHSLLFFPREPGPAAVALAAQVMGRKADGPLAAALSAAANHDAAFGLDVNTVAAELARPDQKDAPPPPFAAMLKARAATFTADFDRTARGQLTLTFPDAAAAKAAAPDLEAGIALVLKELSRGLDDPRGRDRPLELGVYQLFATALKATKVSVEDDRVLASGEVPVADEVTKLVAALPKTLKTFRANRKAINNLKQLALGMHNFESALAHLPGDVVGGGDKPLAWSWRVQILPYLEQGPLYNKLDLTKPWDDPANLKVLEAAEMPKVFEHPGRPAPKGHTYFRVFSLPKGAKGTDAPMFEEGKRAPRLIDVSDGLSNTLMIVEAGEAVPWYKPDVLAYDGKLPLPQLGDKDTDLFLAALGDGSARAFRPSTLGQQTLRALITRAGGEVIPDLDR
ncbi:Protein containing DUF1559 OS=Rhodopirellula maiorica SM1 GN=RMSM_02894 PE=4 SV=1: SBP_bac_10 [Gemmataceae bacterium]|nr:Protein containing DUF1559 OS=Rhodopirellula maiorica SM1 GN=RMSM_02894 PE=4 SV=1: SBP_bac_10 [Gemmataceae bacterium]VTU02032.1 Protein containing DUF1559 OS=Rhodopirellula maiorica SM1 GN=RMSM_02894 PE=4 SV=1: SBP_bac_10 [Gemmataceae bacterium]